MMTQFVVWTTREGERRLFVYETARYDLWYGFHKLIKTL